MAIRKAFVDGSLAAVTGVWGAFGGVLGLILYLVTEKTISPFWGLVLGLYVALFIKYNEVTKSNEALATTLRALNDSQPRVRFEQLGGPTKINRDEKTGRALEIRQLWFVNEPVTRGAAATAKKLSATVEFCDDEWRGVLPKFRGIWAITRQHDHVGWIDLEQEVDLGALPARAKLMLVGQGRHYLLKAGGVQERGVWALAGENGHAYPEWNHPSYRLPVQVTRVRVVLSAENMGDQHFDFRIEREENGTVMGLHKM